jgi:hypothetical protein
MSQFTKLEQDFRARGKNSALREGELRVRLDEVWDALLTINAAIARGSTLDVCVFTKNSMRHER